MFDNLVTLTDTNWERLVTQEHKNAWLVVFYDTRDGKHSEDLSPKLMKARNIVAGKRTDQGSGVKFGRVNLKEQQRLGYEMEITRSPTLRLYKPDGTRSKVKLNVQMKHVLPLMRYTTAFKCNVEQGSLDMPYRDEYNLVIGTSKYGEQYNYVIERVSTLISIILLAGDPGGLVCAFVFLSTKGMSWSPVLSFGPRARWLGM